MEIKRIVCENTIYYVNILTGEIVLSFITDGINPNHYFDQHNDDYIDSIVK